MAGIGTFGSNASNAIQNLLQEGYASTKKAVTGTTGIKSWLIVGVTIFLVLFLVKKVSK